MKNYIQLIEDELKDKLGIENVKELDYMDLPEKRSQYNTNKVIGNKNLVAGRFKTEKEANETIENFLSIVLP